MDRQIYKSVLVLFTEKSVWSPAAKIEQQQQQQPLNTQFFCIWYQDRQILKDNC